MVPRKRPPWGRGSCRASTKWLGIVGLKTFDVASPNQEATGDPHSPCYDMTMGRIPAIVGASLATASSAKFMAAPTILLLVVHTA